MKELIGSEKQIKWAEDIRADFIEKIGNATKEDCKIELEESGDPEDLDYAFFTKIIKTILNQEKAKWWIENMENIELYDINILAEAPDEEDWQDFLNAYKIKA